MSASTELPSAPQPPLPRRRFWLTIGLVALLLGAIVVLAQRSGGEGMATGGASIIVLAVPAFLVGMLSLLSPCTLPILPAYFAFTFQARREQVVQMTLAFFLGLATTILSKDNKANPAISTTYLVRGFS